MKNRWSGCGEYIWVHAYIIWNENLCTAFVLGIYLIYLWGYSYYIVTRVFKALWKIKNSKLWSCGLFGEGVELVVVGWKNIEPTWNNNLRFDRRRASLWKSYAVCIRIYTCAHTSGVSSYISFLTHNYMCTHTILKRTYYYYIVP